MKSWLQDNDMEMYSTHNEGKFGGAENFIVTLKSKIYRYLTSISNNGYIDKLDDIANKYNNTCHSTIKMKPVDVKSSTYTASFPLRISSVNMTKSVFSCRFGRIY